MTTIVEDFDGYPGWKAAWCFECARNIYVGRDLQTVRVMALRHDDEHPGEPDAFAGPEFKDFG
jgi:hypothetical protein